MTNETYFARKLATILRSSAQGSYRRRAPEPQVAEALRDLVRDLGAHYRANPADHWVLALRSKCHEALMAFEQAIHDARQFLERGAGRKNKMLKAIAQLEEARHFWYVLGLTPYELQALGDFLVRDDVTNFTEDADFAATRLWLNENAPEREQIVLDGLRDLGAFDDHDIVANILE